LSRCCQSPKSKQRRDKRGRPLASNRVCFEGILLDSAVRCRVAISPRRISFAFHLLASATTLAGTRRVAGRLAGASWNSGRGRRGQPAALGQSFLTRQFRPGKKGASRNDDSKADEISVATGGDGLSIAPTRGWDSSAVCWCVTNIYSPSSTLSASGSLRGIVELALPQYKDVVRGANLLQLLRPHGDRHDLSTEIRKKGSSQ